MCQLCSKRHHTSICGEQPRRGTMMSSFDDEKVVYPVVVVNIGGIECRALIYSGAASSYASAKLLDKLGKQPTEVKPRKVMMLMASTTTKMEMYQTTVSSKDGHYKLEENKVSLSPREPS